MFEKLKTRFRMDKNTAFKWSLILGAGILGLIADFFDRKKKDQVFEETVTREINKRIDKLTEPKTEG